ncbi:MAG: MFS transporter [Usitatibacter sp.]
MALPHTLRALRSPNFRRYYTGQTVSMIGTWIQSVALMWLAYRLTGSTFFTGLVGFLQSIPHLLIGPLAGVLGDRMDRRRLLMIVLSLMALQSATLAILAWTGYITTWSLALLAAFGGICNAFETPTRQSIFVQLIDKREDLPNAIALNSMLMNGTRLIGPSIGGLLIAASGETLCFVLNALSYTAVLWALKGVKLQPRVERPRVHPMVDLAEGWRYAMGWLPVRRMLITLALVSASISPYATLMPAMAVNTFGHGAELVGLFIGCVGLGAVFAAYNLARRPNIRGLGNWIPRCAIIAGLGMAGFGFSTNIYLSCLLLMLTGFGMFLSSSSVNTILQTIVDEEKRSRVMSYYTTFFIGAAPFGHYAAGWLAEHVGVRVAFMISGSVAVLTGLIFLARAPSFRAELRAAYIQRGIIPADPTASS